MKNVRKLLLLPALLALGLGGCVSSGKYQMKEQEASQLASDLGDLRQKYTDLTKENEGLKATIAKLNGNVDELTKTKEKLTTDNKELNDVLKAKSDTLSKNIADLRQKVADLEEANGRLKQEVASLQKAKEEKVQEVSKTYEQLMEKMKGEISQGQVAISELKGKLTVKMVDAILFDSGKAEVKPEGLKVLQKVVDILKNVTDKAIRIEGHTDNVPIRGALTAKYPTNWELSAARAINVTKFLQQQGIDPANLGAIAFAEYRPVADNATPTGRAMNRRIEITLVHKDTEDQPAPAK